MRPSIQHQPPVPFAALLIASLASAALAALLWWMGTAPCGWGWTPELANACSKSPVVIGPLVTIPAAIVGAVAAKWSQRFWPFFLGLGLTFVAPIVTWLAMWQFPFE